MSTETDGKYMVYLKKITPARAAENSGAQLLAAAPEVTRPMVGAFDAR
jgi:hypothetical protein